VALYDDTYPSAYEDESARKWFENLFMPSFNLNLKENKICLICYIWLPS